MKLWDKGKQLNELVEQFTVGDDAALDAHLLKYDALGSIAHAMMLSKIGILKPQELATLKVLLNEIIKKAENNESFISKADEDVHSAIEAYLTQHAGDIGKKIHTGRSRNDQIILDLRLYMRDTLLEIVSATINLCVVLLKKADAYKEVPIPGRTHFQKAMPASIGLYFAAHAEALLDDCALLMGAYELINQCPLGSASGFGVSLPIDREYVSDLLGFAKVQNNVLYVQNSRGKIESILISAYAQLMLDLSKMATDLIIWSAPEFDYITLPDALCTGSSLMPNKKNPDVLELIRAFTAAVLSNQNQITTIMHALPSGYFRDLQTTKYPLMNSTQITLDCLNISNLVISDVVINENACIAACTPEIFATDQALKLVEQGVPFRTAYQQVAASAYDKPVDSVAVLGTKTHTGAPGNLALHKAQEQMAKINTWCKQQSEVCQHAFKALKENS